MLARILAVASVAAALVGCAGGREQDSPDPAPVSSASDGGRTGRAAPSRTPRPRPDRTTRTAAPTPRETPPADPRWVFFTEDERRWASPWFAGRHRLMVPFGCTPAPYYEPDPACAGGQGFHHGIDVAMPCGTPLRAGRAAEVLDDVGLGSAYGTNPVLLRVGGQDVVIGHTTEVLVEPGDRVAPGERFALAGDSGAPDGCHLHFEVRPAGGSYLEAVDPTPLLGLRRR